MKSTLKRPDTAPGIERTRAPGRDLAKKRLTGKRRKRITVVLFIVALLYIFWLFGPFSNRLSWYFADNGQTIYRIKAGEPVISISFNRGKLYVATSKRSLYKYTVAGRLIAKYRLPQYVRQIAVDDRGFIYGICEPNPAPRAYLSMMDDSVTEISRYDYMQEILDPVSVFASKDVVMAESSGMIRKFRFTSDSLALQKRFGGSGTNFGQFRYVSALAIDEPSGDMYVCDTGNRRIQVFGGDGEFKKAISVGDVSRLLLSEGKLYLEDKKGGIKVAGLDGGGSRLVRKSLKSGDGHAHIAIGEGRLFLSDGSEISVSKL